MSDFDMYRLFKFIHIIGVLMLASGISFESAIGPMMARASTIQDLRIYTKILAVAENILFPVGALVTVIGGYGTASAAHYDMNTTWLLLGQVFFYIMAAIGLGILRRAAKKLENTVKATPDGPLTDDIRAQLKSPIPPMLGSVLTLLFVITVYLMVAKPMW